MKIFYILLCVMYLSLTNLYAQFSDSLKITIGTVATVATKGYQPLWIISNRYGTISSQRSDLSTHIFISNKHTFENNRESDTDTNIKQLNKQGFYIEYGTDIYNNNHFDNVFIQEAYIKTGYKTWQIRGGRYEEIIGEVDSQLSSGSLGISSNALPIPKIGIAVTNFTHVPLTKGWLHFKGQLSHGWLGKTNYLKSAFLHEKSFYLKIGKKQLSIYGGLNHFAQWGGTHPLGQAPNRFKDYLRIVVGAKGNGSDPEYQQGPIDIANAVGNHLIIPDFGMTIQIKESIFRLYTQTIFEKGQGRSASERDKLAGLKIFSRDRLAGLNWETTKKSFLEEIVIEGIYTKYQGGPITFKGRDNYYNNATYRTGWEYQDYIIGTPLFINRKNAFNYNLNLDIKNFSGWNIVSNRIIGIHAGLKGNISNKLNYRTLATYVHHYGNYYNDAAFAPFKKQSHILLESSYQLNKRLIFTAALSQEFGDLSSNTGTLFKIEWNLK